MVRITQATEQDFPSVRSLFLEYVQWLIPLLETAWGYSVTVTAAAVVDHDMATVGKFMPPDGRLFLARDEAGVIGCACAWTMRSGLAEVKRVYVRPNQRGQGAGRALLQALIADLQGAGYTAVWLETSSLMPVAETLYRSLGFQDIAPYDESEAPEEIRHHSTFLGLSL